MDEVPFGMTLLIFAPDWAKGKDDTYLSRSSGAVSAILRATAAEVS